MNRDEYKIAVKVAEDNLNKIKKQMPPSLAAREEKLFVTIYKHEESYSRKLEKIYAILDDLNSFISQYTPCHKGCCECCHIEVAVSTLEVKYIENHLAIVPNWNGNIKQFYGAPCPFLTNNLCSIYKYRPFVCRRHHALMDNPEWCKAELSNNYIFPQVRFSEVEKSFGSLIKRSGSSLYDIRHVFVKT